MARLHGNMFNALNDDIIRKLRTVNVDTVFDFLQCDDEKLLKLTKLPFQTMKEIKNQIFADFRGNQMKSALEISIIEEVYIVSTGLSSLDDLLDGGLHPGKLYELCGLSSAGKTQLCLSLAINVILKTDGIVQYVDTKRDFSAGRIQTMLDAQGHDDETAARVMHQINVTRVTNIYELLSFLYILSNSLKLMTNENKPTKLVIIDSLSSLLLITTSDYNKGTNLLNHVANVSRFIANEFKISLITTNLISEWREFDGFNSNVVDNTVVVKPMMGKYWIKVPNTRLIVEKIDNETRKIYVWKSLDLKSGTHCCVHFNDSGISS